MNTTFLLLNFSDEPQPQTRLYEQILICIEACALGADFIHRILGAVAGLSESMARLRFLYALIDSALHASIEKRVLTKRSINMKLKSLNFFPSGGRAVEVAGGSE